MTTENNKPKLKFWQTLRNFFRSLVRGEVLISLGADKYFPHIAYTFLLFWLLILLNMKAENTMGQMEKNKKILSELRIYHMEKEVELASFHRISKIEKLLEQNGSAVGVPEKPAITIKKH